MRLLSSVYIAASLTSCLLGISAHGSQDATEIKVVTEEFPPYNYSERGLVKGLSTEVVEAVLNNLDITAKFEVYPWARAYMLALNDNNTLIYSIGRNSQREELFQWVGVIAPAKSFLFSLQHRTDIEINSLNDAKKYVVGVNIDSLREQYLIDNDFIKELNIASNVSSKSGYQMLLKERIDLWAMSELVAYDILNESGHPRNAIRKVYQLAAVPSEGYYMAFSLNTSDVIVDKFITALNQIKQDGTYQKILEKHLFPR